MLGFANYYHQHLRKVTIVFGTLFNEIYLSRKDDNNVEAELIKVPIAYGPKEKFLTRMLQDPDLNRPVAIQVPRMSFQITNILYDGARKRNKIRKNVKGQNNSSNITNGFDGVPYKIGMELTIIAKYQDDANQILEQILPFFTPDFSPTYIPVPELGFQEDLPIELLNVNYSDNYDDDWKNRRNIIYTLNFDILAYFYGPIRSSGLIKKAQTDLLIPPGDGSVTDTQVAETPRSIRFTIEPDPLNANPEDDFGYTTTREEFDDGKKYNPVSGNDEDIT